MVGRSACDRPQNRQKRASASIGLPHDWQKTVPLAAGSWLDKAAQLYGRRFEPDGSA
jgi:hypothetical protein